MKGYSDFKELKNQHELVKKLLTMIDHNEWSLNLKTDPDIELPSLNTADGVVELSERNSIHLHRQIRKRISMSQGQILKDSINFVKEIIESNMKDYEDVLKQELHFVNEIKPKLSEDHPE